MRQGFIAFPSRKYREIERGIRVCFISTDREEMTSPDVFENAAVKHNVPSGPSYNKSEKRLQEKARVHHYNSKIWHAHSGTAEWEGLVGLQPYHFYCWDLLLFIIIAGIYYLALQLTWKKYGFFYLKVILGVYSCIFHASRQRPGRHKRDAHKNAHWSELRPLLAWLANRRFQESDALRPDWRLVLVHLGYFPKLPKITFKILRRVYYRQCYRSAL